MKSFIKIIRRLRLIMRDVPVLGNEIKHPYYINKSFSTVYKTAYHVGVIHTHKKNLGKIARKSLGTYMFSGVNLIGDKVSFIIMDDMKFYPLKNI